LNYFSGLLKMVGILTHSFKFKQFGFAPMKLFAMARNIYFCSKAAASHKKKELAHRGASLNRAFIAS